MPHLLRGILPRQHLLPQRPLRIHRLQRHPLLDRPMLERTIPERLLREMAETTWWPT